MAIWTPFGQRPDGHTFFVNFDIFKGLYLITIGPIYTKLIDFGLHLRLLYVDRNVQTLNYVLYTSPSRYEIRQWPYGMSWNSKG